MALHCHVSLFFTCFPFGYRCNVLRHQVLEVNGSLVSSFTDLEEILDNNVGGSMDITVARSGAKLQFVLPVRLLELIIPCAKGRNVQ
jgi:hypothetical protein